MGHQLLILYAVAEVANTWAPRFADSYLMLAQKWAPNPEHDDQSAPDLFEDHGRNSEELEALDYLRVRFGIHYSRCFSSPWHYLLRSVYVHSLDYFPRGHRFCQH
jgi:hypothetical protein